MCLLDARLVRSQRAAGRRKKTRLVRALVGGVTLLLVFFSKSLGCLNYLRHVLFAYVLRIRVTFFNKNVFQVISHCFRYAKEPGDFFFCGV
jgi:hypothetical protein